MNNGKKYDNDVCESSAKLKKLALYVAHIIVRVILTGWL